MGEIGGGKILPDRRVEAGEGVEERSITNIWRNTATVKPRRGRPPKPKAPEPAGVVVSPPWPLGRPPKPRDLFAPIAPSKKKSSGGKGRPHDSPALRGPFDSGYCSHQPIQSQRMTAEGEACRCSGGRLTGTGVVVLVVFKREREWWRMEIGD
ncbi:hypothetical protein LWI29_014510 [Acer saccharum]|uniref:Uncharacterized protein n=1 Tax=Acer saccharum TaxID=4024 RepID=A0AA39VXY4_ACESA|nr:hypothetical protein LWI29_014510 [Acer saccharum]